MQEIFFEKRRRTYQEQRDQEERQEVKDDVSLLPWLLLFIFVFLAVCEFIGNMSKPEQGSAPLAVSTGVSK